MHKGEVALVTGANKGIGKQIVRRLAAEGMTVYLGARDVKRGRTAAGEIDGDVRFVRLDVTDAGTVEAAAKRIEQNFGRLDVLVNNAGVAVEWGIDPDRVGADELRRAYEVNVFGVVTVIRATIPLLRRAPGARVVNMSSPLGSLTLMNDSASAVSERNLLAYNSSKAALNALTVMYANVLRPNGILVNAANPGLVGTDLNGLDPERDGVRAVEQGAEVPVRLSLLSADGPTGGFFGDDEFAVNGTVPW
ncbi:dehydrogenase [Streptomyces albus subsp. albus]|nr:dehydrogenase [Streptomyces albus subsp. albus]